ncbi:MAG: DUF1211 domain-containing protein [Hyphomicrobiaceae bacterium]|nr:DUF1211 domain-containing protein [Hyphomicrobiaceae bacterium]MCC0024161.1 DUF1211 domain-containing protein [Hyphomicrobiaceae bacterium]
MTSTRMEAYSDAVIAILITIMVLELKVPHSAELHALVEVWPHLLSYILSFIYLAIYWNNHHHMLHMVERVNGGILWANNLLLFWLSLVPFATAWSGESGFAQWPVIAYSVVLLCAGVSYYILQTVIIRSQGADSKLARAVGGDWKGRYSPAIYAVAIGSAFLGPIIGMCILWLAAAIWLVPDRRIEKMLGE